MIIKTMRWTVLSIFFLTGIEVNAQFSIDAQLRNRFEVRDGYQKLAAKNVDPAAFMSQRTRVTFSYKTENFRIKFTPQDVRIWGDEANANFSGVNGDNASLDMFEGYAEMKFGEDNWLSIGRQTLIYDNEWLLSAANWNQNGNSFDAVVAKLKLFDFNFHIGSSWNTQKEISSDNVFPADRYKSINYLWVNRVFSDNLKASFLHVASGVTETDTTNKINFRQTSGFFGEYKLSDLTVTGNAYYQFGKSQTGKDVSAFLFYADANYKIVEFKLGLGANYMSGNDTIGANIKTDKLFDPIYTSRHTYFGGLDYFRTFSSHTKQGGIVDLFAYVEYSPLKGFSIKNTGHLFSLAQTNSSTPDTKKLGYENDLVAKYKFADWGTLELGHLMMLPESALKKIQNVPNDKFSQFIYLQLTLTPNLYKHKEPEAPKM